MNDVAVGGASAAACGRDIWVWDGEDVVRRGQQHRLRVASQRERWKRRAGSRSYAARLLLVQQTAHALAAASSEQAVCDVLAETIQRAMGYHIVGIYLSDGALLRLVAHGETSATTEENAFQLTPEQGIIGYVWKNNAPYWCADTRKDPHYYQPHGIPNSRSEMAVPLHVDNTPVGVLNVESLELHAFGDEDVATLVAVADQVSVALQRARLYQTEAALRRRAEARARRLEYIQRVGEQLKWNPDEQKIGPQLVMAAREALGFRMVALNLVDQPGDPGSRVRVVATAGIPPEGDAVLCRDDFSLADVTAFFRPEFLLSRSYFIPEGVRIDRRGNAMPLWTAQISNTGGDAWRARDQLYVPLTDHQGGLLYGFLSVDDPQSGRRPEREEVEALEIFADQAVIAYLLARARRQAERDTVTGLLNHRAANARLEAILGARQRGDAPLSLLAIDVDDFKLINDTHGHMVGDSALRHVAALIRDCVRADDLVARLGGDEFLVILPAMERDQALTVVQRITQTVQERPLHIEAAGAIPLRLSIGIAVCPEDALQPQALFAVADSRLYEAKRTGGRTGGVQVRDRSREDLELEGFAMLNALVAAVDNKDRYTREHSEQVAAYACALADTLKLSRESQRTLRIAGLLHDVGKIGVPDRVLRKPGPLEAEEWEAMKQHVILSSTLLRTVGLDAEVLTAVAHHHERWDGKGYPLGLAQTDVPLLGRIMILADAVSAMAMDRPYRAGLALQTIIAELHRQAGTQFDPALVEPFIAVLLNLHEAQRLHGAEQALHG